MSLHGEEREKKKHKVAIKGILRKGGLSRPPSEKKGTNEKNNKVCGQILVKTKVTVSSLNYPL